MSLVFTITTPTPTKKKSFIFKYIAPSCMENKKKILFFCSADHALTHAVILSLAPLLLAIKEEFNFSYSVSFGFAALNIFIYGTGGIPAGYLSDRVGPLKAILLGIIIVIISCFALAFSFGATQFVIFIFLLGLGSSFYHPPGITAISNSYTERRGRAMGFHGLIGNLGQFGSPFLAGVVGALFGWRANYLVWGVSFVLLGLFLLYLMWTKADADILALVRAEKEQNERKEEGIPPHSKTTRSSFFFIKRETLELILKPMVLFILLLSIFRGWYYRGVLYILPFYVEDFFHLSPNAATALGGTFVTFALISGGIGNYVGGHMKDRHGSVYPLVLFTFISLISTLLIVFNPFTLGEREITFNGENYVLTFNAFVIGVFLFGFGYFGGQAPLNTFIAEMVSSEKRGRLFGISFFTRFGLSSLAMLMVGVAADSSLFLALSLNLLFILLALATILGIKLYAKKQRIIA